MKSWMEFIHNFKAKQEEETESASTSERLFHFFRPQAILNGAGSDDKWHAEEWLVNCGGVRV